MVIQKQRFHHVKQGLKKLRVAWDKVNIYKHWKRYREK